MSSSNRVQLNYIEEVTYGETPAGDLTQAKFISESLTGTPITVESKEIRADRNNSGQVNTGLELSGGFDFELSADQSQQDFIQQAMMDGSPVASVVAADDVSINDALMAVERSAGSFVTDGFLPYTFVKLSGFTETGNNTVVFIESVQATIMQYSNGLTLTTEVEAAGQTVTMMKFHEIGTDDLSMTISKEFQDVNPVQPRSLTYRGMRVGQMNLNFGFGEIITGSFALAGNGYDQPAAPLSAAETVIPAGSDPALDASNNFGFILVDSADSGICMENIALTLSNNLAPQNCIGSLAPTDQIAGSATVGFESTMHLSLAAWDKFMAKKLTQVPVSIVFYSMDANGNGYGVYLSQVQVNFPDPSSSGKDEQVKLEASGFASYNSSEAISMRLFTIS